MRSRGQVPPIQLRGLIAALGLVACGGPLEANGAPSQTLTIKAGRELGFSQGPTIEDTVNVQSPP